MNQVKFSVFADLHLHDIWGTGSEKRLDAILERAKKENVDFIIDLGDFCHDPLRRPNEAEAVKKYANFEIPTYHVLGNHDMDGLTLKEAVELFQMPAEYYYFDKNGFRFICLNENYFRYEGVDIPYEKRNYYAYGKERDYIPREQVKWFEETVMSSPYPMVVLSHGSLARENDDDGNAIKNREEMQNIIRKAHKNGKRILLCLNGHFHVDYMQIYEHVCYLDINSASMVDLFPPINYYYPEEFSRAPYVHRKASQIYEDPVHAIITLTDDGTIDIEGMKTKYWYNINREMLTGRECSEGVRLTPDMMSEKIRLPMKL